MAISTVRRRRSAFAAGLATMAMALGFAAISAEAAQSPLTDYVALGDSYAAGQGAAPYTDRTCFVSRRGYPVIADNLKGVQLNANAGCSGYTSGAVAGNLPSSVTGAEVITITVGANDVGTTGILLACLPAPSSAECGGALGATQAKLTDGTLATSLFTMVSFIRSQAPNAKIVLTGYPRLFAPDHPFAPVANPMVDGLNGVIAGVAGVTGSQFVDVTGAFAGHGVGSAAPWINFNAANILDPANFHPTGEGYRLGYYASLVSQRAYVLS
ncbi:SGNH/GDSL hydrolase family protein [Pseudarthrobacter cellobiosi]|uniref:SGNH/GDSL hydrolase family protein n=1 Tax=Pseudarthrobacter cellobiosi TaxID=2953654 RepID=UPI00208E0BF0|nr:SGNH/GDSL hydrolase family protein [Pseudarthrobacter sp. HLT1-5]MCO4253901.1 SGNH/GDSL hydrolase family protein [Pseudarthrobacter sp. HLT1-5]